MNFKFDELVNTSLMSPFSCCLLISLLLGVHQSSASYHTGDIVSSARRGQFSGSRTSWHDLLARHCAKFGTESKVAIPIPQPKGFKAVQNNYKIQFVFDGNRIYSPWIQIIGKKTPAAPILLMQFEHHGDLVTSVKAEIVPVNSEYLREHEILLREFQNATLWPKHLLVHYTWKPINPINTDAGLYFIFILGILITAILGISVLISYEQKLKTFLADLKSEEASSLDAVAPSASFGGTQKIE